jgi:hypothetical protein
MKKDGHRYGLDPSVVLRFERQFYSRPATSGPLLSMYDSQFTIEGNDLEDVSEGRG